MRLLMLYGVNCATKVWDCLKPYLDKYEVDHVRIHKIAKNNVLWNLPLDLKKSKIPMRKVSREIILGDLGGVQEFVSSVYLFDIENHVMLHLYDDRGLDIVAHDKNILMPLYQKLNTYILVYLIMTVNK